MVAKIGYQDIRTRILERIRSKEWPLGSALPSEVSLAAEFKCARATVNRALVLLAEEGIIDRKRKAGSRVSDYPKKVSRIELKLVRTEMEERGLQYECKQLSRTFGAPPDWMVNEGRIEPNQQMLFIESLHLGDGKPVQLQRTWINASLIPHAADHNFDSIAPCEWLRADNPLCRGNYELHAVAMESEVAKILKLDEKAPALQLTIDLMRDDEVIAIIKAINVSCYEIAGAF